MYARQLGLIFGFLIGGYALAQTQNVQQPRPLVASVEARWEHVYCDLTELARTSAGDLSVRYQYRNTKAVAQPLPHANLVPETQVLDVGNSTLYGVLTDASGKPISSTMLDGAAARPIEAGGTQGHWVRLRGPAVDVRSVTVLVQGCLPFDDVAIGGVAAAMPLSKPATVIASQEGEAPGVAVELIGVNRGAGGFVTISFRYRNTGASEFRFPHQATIRNTYILDNANRRKYEVVLDQRQEPLCSETLGLHSQAGDSIEAGTAMTMWAKLAAPPDSTETLTVAVPYVPPFDDVPITGVGAGSAGGGSAIAGSAVGLEAALQELDAAVSETEIRIELAADVLFDFDQAELKSDAGPSLQNVATVLKANPMARVDIEGHTDAMGADAYNQTLSERRAASVKQWLVTNAQVDGATITTRGWGKTKPVAHNTKPDGSDDPEGRAKNRRVEIVVTKGR